MESPPATRCLNRIQNLQVFEVSQFRRNLSLQLVVGQVQVFQVFEVCQFRWNLLPQPVIGEVQVFQVGEVAKFGGNWSPTTHSRIGPAEGSGGRWGWW